MARLYRTLPVQVESLGDREVMVTMSTDGRARDGHILEPAGCDLSNYERNPIVLWSHDPDHPIGNNNDVTVQAHGITARCVFAPEGISREADKICGLVKAGVIRTVSIGFDILDGDPIDPARPRAGLRVSKWELYEMSFVSVPADTGAVVTAREAPDHTLENLRMTERAAKIGKLRIALLTDAAGAPRIRGLYDVAQLAYLLQQLAYAKSSADWETEMEGDDSAVPAMIGEVLKSLGDALIAMTHEEVAELIANAGLADVIEETKTEAYSTEDRAFIAAGTTQFARAWRRAQVHARAGKAISAANAAKMGDALDHLADAKKRAATAATSQGAAADHGDALADIHARAATIHGKMADAIEAASGAPPADVTAKIAKVQQHHKQLGKQLDSMGERCASMADTQSDAQDGVNGFQRCVRSAMRCVRAVLSSPTADTDEDTKDIQTSDGDGDSGGANNDRGFSAEFRLRRLSLLEKSAP